MAKPLDQLAPEDIFEVGVNYVSLVTTKRYMNSLLRPTAAGKVGILLESKQNVYKTEPEPRALVNLAGLPIYDFQANFVMRTGNSYDSNQSEFQLYDQDYVEQQDQYNVFNAQLQGFDRSFEFSIYNYNASSFAISALEVTGIKLPNNSISGV